MPTFDPPFIAAPPLGTTNVYNLAPGDRHPWDDLPPMFAPAPRRA